MILHRRIRTGSESILSDRTGLGLKNITIRSSPTRDPFFGVSVSKGFGLELFVLRLCIGYFSWSFARRRSLKNGFKNDCSEFSRWKRSEAKLSLLLCCLRDGEYNLPSTLLQFILNSIKNVHEPKKPQHVISATRGWEYLAKDYLWTVFPRVLLRNP